MIQFSFRLLASIRAYQHHASRAGAWHGLMRKFARSRHLFWSVMTQSDVDPRAALGGGLMLPHPNGIVIHEDSVIGDDCMIMQQVTIGMDASGLAPTIGSKVYVGAGAKILGKVAIGDGARIGANAVVLGDIPAGCTAVGVPARVVKTTGKPKRAARPKHSN